jgi:DNA-directed RNA polymerase specialized sigma subunit
VERRAQSHIGEVLGISASRVCQLERDAISALREKLQRDGWTPSATGVRS